jgi:hypothetical protein
MPIGASAGTLDIENATLRSNAIAVLTNLVTGNDAVRSSGAPTLEVYGDPSNGGNEARLELVSNLSVENSKSFTRLTSNAGVFSIQSGTDGTTNGPITFGGFSNERMRIAADGNVGIGTDNPTGQLEVHGEGQTSFTAFNQSGNMGGTLVLRSDDGSPGSGGAVMFGSNNGFHAAIKASLVDGSVNTRGHLAFFVRNDFNDATMSHAMTIADSGNVGIGKTDPGTALEVVGTIRVQTGTNDATGNEYNIDTNVGHIRRKVNGNGVSLTSYDDFQFYVNATGGSAEGGTQAMIIDNSGNVGIGTTSPTDRLDVHYPSPSFGAFVGTEEGSLTVSAGAEHSNAAVYFRTPYDAAAPAKRAIISDGGGFSGGTSGGLHFCLEGNNNNITKVDLTDSKMMVRHDGNVGIGTTSPARNLHVFHPTYGVHRSIYWSEKPGNPATENPIQMGYLGSSDPSHASGAIGLFQNTYEGATEQEKVRIQANGNSWFDGGNVGIGITNPDYPLDVNGAARLGRGSARVYIGGNLGGNFIDFNDDLSFNDPQNSTIEIRNISDTAFGTMVGTFSPGSSEVYKKDIDVLTQDDLTRFYKDTIETNLYSYYYLNEVAGEDKKRIGVILERSPDYFAETRDGRALNTTHWNTMLHGACKVIDQNVKTVMNDMKNHLNFTGQHRTFISDVPLSDYENYEGLIVSADTNKYYNDSVDINEALPIVTLCKKNMDKACFGVISSKEDPNNYGYNAYVKREDGDIRAKINSIGEGGIWVINTTGNFESGDYITTSNCVPGYGQRQNDDILHNYTVAKITTDCDFDTIGMKKRRIKKELGDVTYYIKDEERIVDKNVYDIWDPTKRQIKEIECYTKEVITASEKPLEGGWIEYISNNSNNSITEKEYDSATPEVKETYRRRYRKQIIKTMSIHEYNMIEDDDIKNKYQKNLHTFHFVTVHKETKIPTVGYTTEIRQELINVLDEHGQIQWEDDPSGATEKVYKIRYLDADGNITDEANHVYKAAFVGCTYHCG